MVCRNGPLEANYNKEMDPEQHMSSVCDTITIKQELEMDSEQHTSSVCDTTAFKQEPVEAVEHLSPKQEIEYILVKEETLKWEMPDGDSSAQDPLSIAKEELKHEVESTNGDNEPESAIPVGVKDDSGTNDSGSLVARQEASCGSKSGIKHQARCAVCKKTFATYQDLKKHKQVDSRKCLHFCNVCHKTFILSVNLEAHIRLHTGERPYSCEVCNKTFAQSSSLRVHWLTHTDDRPYICGICHKRYKSRNVLKQHSRTHTGDRVCTCDVCGESFRAHSDLRRHSVMHTGLRMLLPKGLPYIIPHYGIIHRVMSVREFQEQQHPEGALTAVRRKESTHL